MNISGIRPNTAFYTNNTIQNEDIREVSVTDAKTSSGQAPPEEAGAGAGSSSPAVRQDFQAKDYAAQYQPNESYSLKGEDSDLASLDMEKAISSMQKDKAIQQYQFFVGEKKMQNELEQKEMQKQVMEDFTVL